jgi:hypothetical protein
MNHRHFETDEPNHIQQYEQANDVFKPGAFMVSSRFMMRLLNAFQLKATVDELNTSDIELLARLIILLNKKRSTIEETPPVYWYTRKGR